MGTPSKTAKEFTCYLNDNNYDWVVKSLFSTNNAERFLAIIILEKLAEIDIDKVWN